MSFVPNINAARILVVESDPDAMRHTSQILEDAGYYVQRAYNAGDAIYAQEHSAFDLAVLDAARNGDPAGLAELAAALGGLPWIALVSEHETHLARYLEAGAAAYVQHPVVASVLKRQVRNALEGEPMRDLGDELDRHLIEQHTLSAITRSLSAVLDLDTLLAQIVDAAVDLSHAEEGLLLLPDEGGKALYIRAAKGIDSETAKTFRIRTNDTLAGQILHTGEPVLVGDQGLQKLKTEYLVHAMLYVPLSIKGETIGVLGVNNKRVERSFDNHDMDVLQDLAAHAAVAIENARLYETHVQRAHELHTLVESSRAVNSTLAIDEVLSTISRQLIEFLGVSQCYIGEWQPDDGRLHTLAVSYRAVWPAMRGPSMSSHARAAIARASEQKRVIIARPPLSEDQEGAAWFPHRYLVRGMAHLPLFTQERSLGVVSFYRFRAPFEAGEDLRSTFSRLQQSALELVVQLTGHDAVERRSVLFASVQQMLDQVQADWCEVALWSAQYDQYIVALSYGAAIWGNGSLPVLDLARFPQLRQIVETQQPFAGQPVDDLAQLCQREGGRSLLGLPLLIAGRVAGLVMLTDALREHQFSRREIEFARALVTQAASAISNARLYRDLELSLEELHRAQAKLVQTARLMAMGELAAAVAHQINNPLTTVMGDAELLLRDFPEGDPHRESLEAIFRAGKRAREVVRRLLIMARKQSGEEALEPLDLNLTINNTISLVRSHVQQGGVHLVVQLAPDLPRVYAVQGQLEDVWLNLLLNARDAVIERPTPEIGISSECDGDNLVVRVWDNGTGIDTELLNQIFDPFFTTKPAGEGTGLGLHICHQSVEKCQGHIKVETVYNEGTQFMVTLPIYSGGRE